MDYDLCPCGSGSGGLGRVWMDAKFVGEIDLSRSLHAQTPLVIKSRGPIRVYGSKNSVLSPNLANRALKEFLKRHDATLVGVK